MQNKNVYKLVIDICARHEQCPKSKGVRQMVMNHSIIKEEKHYEDFSNRRSRLYRKSYMC